MDLVTLQEAQQHIRIDTEADTPWLNIMIPGISEAVKSWLKDPWRPYEVARDELGAVIVDAAGAPVLVMVDDKPVVRPAVKSAVLVELAQQYRFRDGSGAAAAPAHWGHGHVLGAGATSLLSGLRKGTVA